MDSKLNHRLTDLQVKASAQEKAQIEQERDQAQAAARDAKMSAVDAAGQAEKLATANAKVAELEAQAKDRMINQPAIDKFKSFLIGKPTCPVWVINSSLSRETGVLALTMRKMLDEAGFAVTNNVPPSFAAVLGSGSFGNGLYSPVAPVPVASPEGAVGSVLISDSDRQRTPVQALTLLAAFKAAEIKMNLRVAPSNLLKTGDVAITIDGK
jgi:hypothetical protein